jgi:hypothetical protein
MDDCQRCGHRLPWNSGLRQLVGGYECLLCSECVNAWHAYFLTLPQYAAKRALDSEYDWLQGRAMAQDAPTRNEWHAHRDAKEAWYVEMFHLSQAWMAAGVGSDVPREGLSEDTP